MCNLAEIVTSSPIRTILFFPTHDAKLNGPLVREVVSSHLPRWPCLCLRFPATQGHVKHPRRLPMSSSFLSGADQGENSAERRTAEFPDGQCGAWVGGTPTISVTPRVAGGC